MYRFAICDDEIDTCNQLEGYITSYLDTHYIKGDIDVFFSGEKLCQYLLSNNNFSIIFLDIELPKINGVKVGQYVRNHLEDEITDIVYISSKTSYAMELFGNRPLDFLVKPLTYDKIEKVLDIAIKRNGVRERCFEYQIGKVNKMVPLKQILYFKSDNKKIHIILKEKNEIVFNGKLQEIEKKVPSTLFLQIHKSYLVNYYFVCEYNYEWVKMVNGDILNISKINRKNVKEKLLQHMKREE